MDWILKERKMIVPYKKLYEQKYKDLGLGHIMTNVLLNRSADYDTVATLLKKPGDLLEHPSKMAGAEQAATEIIDMAQHCSKVWVFADYDVDGLTAGYIMSSFLAEIGANAVVYYPERKEGYGLNSKFLKTLKKGEGVITVDNGITALKEVQYCKDNGIKIVVTDHHTPKKELPNCTICDPMLGDYGHHLCGAAVAFKLVDYMSNLLGTGNTSEYAVYAALGTIADMMPMVPENMAIVRIGLSLLKAGYAPNLAHFCKAEHVENPSVEEIAWSIAPCLNACGRLGNTQLGGALLFHDGKISELNNIILRIDNLNETRKDITNKAVASAKKNDYSKDEFCLFDATDFPHGISGLIANKLTNIYNKPALVYVKSDNGTIAGSMRGNGVNVLPLLEKEMQAGHIISYGGHAESCGVQLFPDIETFKKSFSKQLKEVVTEKAEEQEVINVDAILELKDLSKKLFNDIKKVPTDKSEFPVPKFIVKNLTVGNIKHSKNNPDNICFTFVEDDVAYDLWAWKLGKKYEQLGTPDKLDIVGTVKRKGFGKDADSIVLNIEDIREVM